MLQSLFLYSTQQLRLSDEDGKELLLHFGMKLFLFYYFSKIFYADSA